MPHPDSDALVELAEQIRTALRRADEMGQTVAAIHLDEALNAVALAEGTGRVQLEAAPDG